MYAWVETPFMVTLWLHPETLFSVPVQEISASWNTGKFVTPMIGTPAVEREGKHTNFFGTGLQHNQVIKLSMHTEIMCMYGVATM